ncbi:MAG: lytic transglycosylase domain-containing protein [Thermoanaerobaculia bacterium]
MKPKRRTADYTWTPPRDFFDICACQRHARRERALWRRVVRGARKRAVTLFVTVPLAFCAIGMEAMNVSLPALAQQAIEMSSNGTREFKVLTTRKVRDAFISPDRVANTLTFDLAKEEFFKAEVPYGSIIYREALKNQLSPELIAAVVESESDFRPRLVSAKAAQGLMQIVPETARLMHCDNPFDPHANIAAGTRYLHYLVDRFGDEKIALAAYNAGEGTVERLGGGIPQYPETIDYVHRVTTRTKLYRQRVQNRYLASVRMQASVIAR